ncbi:MAG: aminotransferase class V-fold PLP-dependent enzyme [Thermomicrobium sp.]|nr:aminotransferase class V-fold PLP-dependent enzyme [Thermomicrobium sp.]MCS7246176.1 aminotransferase class V-fold PLP-dependent enzyme [Thermomicrobium sp.]MDW7982307.1 aminotransferase class V-fold PLP-dependent enzyme [Thermomicrobium sp.]
MGEAWSIEAIRAAMPAVRESVYLNTGTYGPLPSIVLEAMRATAEREWAAGRITLENYERIAELKHAARREVAALLRCRPDQIALTRHTTDGINLAVMGRNWQAGDELVTTDMEHPGAQGPIFNVARRYGVIVRTARLGTGAGDSVHAVARCIGPRTRMVVLSHLTWNTGALLPIAEITELAHRVGALVVVDGAQSAGSIPVDVIALGVDVYAIPGQKWLCGPEGTGAVYVSDDALDQLQLTIVGYASLVQGAVEPIGGYLLPKPTAERFEVGGMHMPAIAGQVAALRWLREELGYEWIFGRIAQLGQTARRRLEEVPGVTVLTPPDRMAGLLTFTVDGCDPQQLVQALARRNVIVRWITHPYAIRLSTGFYNDESDLDRFIEALLDARRELASAQETVR